jgi:hypothetical protein
LSLDLQIIMDQAAQVAALQQHNIAMQNQLLQMAAGQAPANNMIQRVILDKLRNLKWREHDKDGNIIDALQQFERITALAMDPLMPDHEKRILLIAVFENPAALIIDAALANGNLAQEVATYQDLRQYAINSFARTEDKRAAVNAILNGKYIQRGQTVRKFGDELLALQAQIPPTEMGQQTFINCLVNALRRVGKHASAADVLRASPATLAQAITRACEYDYDPPAYAPQARTKTTPATITDGISAHPLPSSDPTPGSAEPTPMELGAMPTAGAVTSGLTSEQLTPLVASITQQTIEATFAALGIRGGFDGSGSSGGTGRTKVARATGVTVARVMAAGASARSRGMAGLAALTGQIEIHAWENCSNARYDPK